jgi:hypothetical protein
MEQHEITNGNRSEITKQNERNYNIKWVWNYGMGVELRNGMEVKL